MHQEDDSARVVGADRVLAVLVELADHPGGITLEDLALRLHSSKPTVHRALTSLRKAGLAHQLGRGLYTLGDEFVRLAYRFQSQRPEGALIEPALHQLVALYGETAHFAVREGSEVVYRAKVDPPEGGVRLTSTVGGRNPAHRTAVGKLLLSYSIATEAELYDLVGTDPLPARTERSITSPQKLWEELQLIKERGYAVDDQENELGINCVAVPVRWDLRSAPSSAVSVSALAFRTPLTMLVDNVQDIQAVIDAATLGPAATPARPIAAQA